MKKIMFNDKYGLTDAVLRGRKTQTRRIVPARLINEYGHNKYSDKSGELIRHARFEVGEEVAIAQSYKDILGREYVQKSIEDDIINIVESDGAGVSNKMFVKAELMPHHIKITNIRVERLMDISFMDIKREGIYRNFQSTSWSTTFNTPRGAFAFLIDKTCGKGTWERNPWVFVYDFELID